MDIAIYKTRSIKAIHPNNRLATFHNVERILVDKNDKHYIVFDNSNTVFELPESWNEYVTIRDGHNYR